MKKITCKILLGIGIFWIFLTMIILSVSLQIASKSYGTVSTNMALGAGALSWIFFNIPAFILIIIAIIKWNSEKETRELRKAQLQALKRGKVNVELKGKIRKLK